MTKPEPITLRRPTGAAPTTQAAAPVNVAAARPATDDDIQRTTVVYPAETLRGLKARAVMTDTTVTELVRDALTAGMADTATLVTESRRWAGVKGKRTTIDLPAHLHRAAKVAAVTEETTVQAIVLAAIARTYPDLLK